MKKRFQFQHGTIKRLKAELKAVQDQHFNSNMVRLKGNLSICRNNDQEYFNSNMVRLKESSITGKPMDEKNFNSNMVRLKVK